MQKKLWLYLLLLLSTACQQKEKPSITASNEVDAGRKFLRAALDGKFDLAKEYLLPDSLNLNYLDVAARGYERLSQPDKENYRGASIIIHENKIENDSITLLIFSNSFKNDKDTLRIFKQGNKWFVDLSYLYIHPAVLNQP
jgi:hypothetical protein